MLGWVLAELMIAHPTYSFQGEMFQLASPRHSPLQLAEALLEHLVLPPKVGTSMPLIIYLLRYTYFSSIFFLPPTYVGIRL